jgi:hypothetical protein
MKSVATTKSTTAPVKTSAAKPLIDSRGRSSTSASISTSTSTLLASSMLSKADRAANVNSIADLDKGVDEVVVDSDGSGGVIGWDRQIDEEVVAAFAVGDESEDGKEIRNEVASEVGNEVEPRGANSDEALDSLTSGIARDGVLTTESSDSVSVRASISESVINSVSGSALFKGTSSSVTAGKRGSNRRRRFINTDTSMDDILIAALHEKNAAYNSGTPASNSSSNSNSRIGGAVSSVSQAMGTATGSSKGVENSRRDSSSSGSISGRDSGAVSTLLSEGLPAGFAPTVEGEEASGSGSGAALHGSPPIDRSSVSEAAEDKDAQETFNSNISDTTNKPVSFDAVDARNNIRKQTPIGKQETEAEAEADAEVEAEVGEVESTLEFLKAAKQVRRQVREVSAEQIALLVREAAYALTRRANVVKASYGSMFEALNSSPPPPPTTTTTPPSKTSTTSLLSSREDDSAVAEGSIDGDSSRVGRSSGGSDSSDSSGVIDANLLPLDPQDTSAATTPYVSVDKPQSTTTTTTTTINTEGTTKMRPSPLKSITDDPELLLLVQENLGGDCSGMLSMLLELWNNGDISDASYKVLAGLGDTLKQTVRRW